MADPYAVLGVRRTASQTEIKSAYRHLARRFHPDVNAHPAAARRFAQINEAYHLLSDPRRRSFYDRTGNTQPPARQASAAGERAARRAYYQARADRIVNEWLEREREESRARGKAVYTTVTLFISTFMVAMMKPSIFESSTPFWRVTMLILFAISIWHLINSLREHFNHYTYRPGRISVTHAPDTNKPFRRGVAWAFVIGGYLISLAAGMLIGMLIEDLSVQLFGQTSLAEVFFGVFFYPPIAVLIVDMMYIVNMRFETL
jgi:hypothetical protein